MKTLILFLIATITPKTKIRTFKCNTDVKFVYTLWTKYVVAMKRRRPGMTLCFNSFGTHITKYCQFIRKGDSYAFGQYLFGMFIPTHFAPYSLRDGMKLIKAMKHMSVCFIVTEDLIPMLRKSRYIIVPIRFKTEFRGELVIKQIAISSLRLLPSLVCLLAVYLNKGEFGITYTNPEDPFADVDLDYAYTILNSEETIKYWNKYYFKKTFKKRRKKYRVDSFEIQHIEKNNQYASLQDDVIDFYYSQFE